MDLSQLPPTPPRQAPVARCLLLMALCLALGLLAGTGAKLLDLHTTHLGTIFSQLSVWVFLCTTLSVYSSTPKQGAGHVFFFCAGMLLAYYVTAELTQSVYSFSYVRGWSLFALCSPGMGYVVWYTKKKHWMAAILFSGMILLMVAATLVLFDKLRWFDFLFILLTGLSVLCASNLPPSTGKRGV